MKYELMRELIVKFRGLNSEQKLPLKKDLIHMLKPFTQVEADEFLPENPTFEDIDNLFEALVGLAQESHADLNAFNLNIAKITMPNAIYILDKIAKNNTLISLELINFLEPHQALSLSLANLLKKNTHLNDLICIHREQRIIPFPAVEALEQGLQGLNQNKNIERIALCQYSIDHKPNDLEKIAKKNKIEIIAASSGENELRNEQINPDNDTVLKAEVSEPKAVEHPAPAQSTPPNENEPKAVEPKPLLTDNPEIKAVFVKSRSSYPFFLVAMVIATPILYITGAPIILSAILLAGLALGAVVSYGLSKRNKPTVNSQSTDETNSQVPPQTVPTIENTSKLEPSITPANESVSAPNVTKLTR